MKKYNIVIVIALIVIAFASCKDDFLEEKRDLTGANEEVFKDPILAQAYVDYVYGLFLPPANNSGSLLYDLSVAGDTWSKTTDEFAGETYFNKPWAKISFDQNHALPYFGDRMNENISNNVWTRMKQINMFLTQVDKYGMAEDVKKKLKGQMFFWRAWQYFDLVRLYGGVPVVLTAQNPAIANTPENSIPRSKTSECIDQICADLDSAMNLLPGKWTGADWGRITSGAAAAMKGRVLLTWASPLFNRMDDRARWQRAYDANLAAKNLLEQNGFGLYKAGTLANAEAWANMFITEGQTNPEAVIVYGFNSIQTNDVKKNNGWEQAARPRDINGSGSLSPTKQMVDAFPMKDGRMSGSVTNPSAYTLDAKKFYKNRDPRFYKTFAYNGAKWPYRENSEYRVWTYRWFAAGANTTTGTPAKTTEANANASSIYLCKATKPTASSAGANGNFNDSGTDVMEFRFAEVLLNLAECAVGVDKFQEAKDGIMAVRERAGVENKDGQYGLAAVTARDDLFAAVLNERKVEFAYEGKRFWDLRRWMLFDDSHQTCSRLHMTPINGTRRTGYLFIARNAAGARYSGNTDPLKGTSASVINREPSTYPSGISNFDAYLDYLYDNYFEIAEKDDLDPTNATPRWVFTWYDAYYFFGLNQNALQTSPYLEQTKGWNGLNGSQGTFDPLQ